MHSVCHHRCPPAARVKQTPMGHPSARLISTRPAPKWPRYEIRAEPWLCNRCAEQVAFAVLADAGYGPPVITQQFEYDAASGLIHTRVAARFRRTAHSPADPQPAAREVWPYPAAEVLVLGCTRCARRPPGQWGAGDAGGGRKNEPKITDLVANAACAWDGHAAVGLSSEHKRALLALWGLPLALEGASWNEIGSSQPPLIEAMRHAAHRFGRAKEDSREARLAQFLWDHVFQRAPD